jgi:outer membrane protein assembly factor BamB
MVIGAAWAVAATALAGSGSDRSAKTVKTVSVSSSQIAWSKFHYDSANTGYNPAETLLSPSTVHNLVRLWEFPTGNAAVLSSPAVVGGTLYVGSNAGSVYALNASSGRKLWSFTAGGAVDSSPAVANGIVYFGSFDQRVYAVRASDGALVWSFNTKGRVESSPDVVNGVVYIGSDSGNVYALDARTGATLWKFAAGSSADAPLAVVNGVVYVSTFAVSLYALNAATGAKLWSFAPGCCSTGSPPAVANGVVYVGNDDGSLYAVNASTGKELWSYQTGANVHGSGPAIANGVVYFGSIDHNVYALDASTGAKLWGFATPGGVESSPAVANGVVYVGASGFIYALNAASGAKLWSFHTGASVNSSPAVVNGKLYVGSDNPAMGVLAFSVPRPVITAVSVAGSTAWPTITVSGSGFGGTPPRGSDNNATGCGYYTDNGELFGTRAFDFADLTAGWSEGCVGIILTSWSPTTVVFQFGDAYGSLNWSLASGDRFTVTLRGVQFSGTVSFPGSRTPTVSRIWPGRGPAGASGATSAGAVAGRTAAVGGDPPAAEAGAGSGGVGQGAAAGLAGPNLSWPQFLHDPGHSSVSAATAFTPSNAASARRVWHWQPPVVRGKPAPALDASPTVVTGRVFIGAQSGVFYALKESTGAVLWSRQLGTRLNRRCKPRGITSTATVLPDPVSGKLTVYVSGAHYLYALNPTTGAVVWKAMIGAVSNLDAYYNWSSPTVVAGHIYVGVAAGGCSFIRGGVAELDQHTGKLLHTWYSVPAGSIGASVWSTPAVSPTGSDVWVSTGDECDPKHNPCPAGNQIGHALSIVHLSGSLKFLQAWQAPGTAGHDWDFGSSPTLFGGAGVPPYVGACNKNGVYYALGANPLSSSPLWTLQVGVPASLTAVNWCLSSSVWDAAAGMMYIGANATTIGGVRYGGSIGEVNPDTGSYVWHTGLPCAIEGTPSLDSAGVLGVGTYTCPGSLHPGAYLIDASTGAVLTSLPVRPSKVFGQPVFADDTLFVATETSGLYDFAP